MADDQQFGTSETASADSILEWKADGSLNTPRPEKCDPGTTSSAEMLPEWDARGEKWHPVPTLRISMTFQPGLSYAQVMVDFAKCYRLADHAEVGHGGRGLRIGTTTGDGQHVEVTLIPESITGAEERLTRVAEQLNDSTVVNGSFQDWKAEVDLSA